MSANPPQHLSAGARDYLLAPDRLEYPSDWSDPWSVQEFREVAHPLWCGLNDLIDFDYDVEADVISGVVVERIRTSTMADGSSDAAIVHLHGGMFCSGTPEIDRVLNAQLARATGVDVLSIDYRLAPEHVFPAAIDDALSVYRALVERGTTVAIVGESAGGGLAVSCALAARSAFLPPPAALGLLSPMLDLTGESDTYRTLAPVDPDYGNITTLLEPARAYAGSTPLDDPLLSPVNANLAGLPPTLIQVGNREVLLGDSTRFTRRARAAGVAVELEVLDGGWHNYPLWSGVPEADAAIDSLISFVTGALT